MAIKPTDGKRQFFLDEVTALLQEHDYEVLRTASQTIAVPCLDDNQNEMYVVITFKVPTGTRNGEPYDGHVEAQDYDMKLEAKEKAKAAKAKAGK